MTPPKTMTDSDLNAYVDGELDERTRLEMEAWLNQHPEDALRVSEYQRQKAELHRRYDPILEEAIPAEMRETVMQARNRTVRKAWLQAAAAVALLLIGASGGWGWRDALIEKEMDRNIAFANRAAGAHRMFAREVRHAVEVKANEVTHLVKWLSKRLGNPLRAPDLERAGYQLVGGRLLPDLGKSAAQFMYEDSAKRRVTVYIRAYRGKDIAFRFLDDAGTATFYWIEAPFAYALSGTIPRPELLKVANLVYDSLTR